MFPYYYDPSYFFCAISTLIITMFAHFSVQFTFNKYSKIKTQENITGLQSAENVLAQNNVEGIKIGHINGEFSDYFDPRKNIISLSNPVYSKNSIVAVGIAAHEAGHAVQYAQKYGFIRMRQGLVPITQICSVLSMPLVFIGLMLSIQYSFIVNVGILLFSVAVLFQLVTLPVEFDASRKGMMALKNSGNFTEEELNGAKKVLNAAAMTYVAALFTSLITLLRLIFLASRRRR